MQMVNSLCPDEVRSGKNGGGCTGERSLGRLLCHGGWIVIVSYTAARTDDGTHLLL
jgi:hypothetical protein